MRKRPFPSLWAVIAAGLAWPACHRVPGADAAATAAEEPALVVKTAAARTQPVARFLRITGELKANTDSMVAADALGKVIACPVERGTSVQAGEVLAVLDSRAATLALREAEAAVSQADSALALSVAELGRNTPLAALKAVSDTDLQRLRTEVASRKANLAAAEARRDSAKKTLADAVIRAPFAGRVAERLVEPGTYVRVDTAVVRLVDIARLRLVIDIPEPALARLRDGQLVTFAVAARPGESFQAKVSRHTPALRAGSRDVLVEADLENPDDKLLPGMFAEGRLLLPEETGIAVPLAAVRTKGPLRSVFVVTGGRAVERLVLPGDPHDGWVEIPGGVAAGEWLVVDPPPALTDGAPVATASVPGPT